MWRALVGSLLLALLLVSPVLAVDLDDLIRMLEAGVGEEVILKVVDADHTEFALTSDDLIDLKDAGASDWLLEELLDRSVEPARTVHRSYRVIEPDYRLISIGLVYDPFDYYFAAWPYYYAYYSPFTFCWNWWYYGGPVHRHWCEPWGWRVNYYHGHLGPRTIWDRGWRGRDRFHVPSYRDDDKEHRQALYGRQASFQGPGARTVNDGGRVRSDRGDKPVRQGSLEPGRRGDKPDRSSTWGRPERRTESQSPSRPSRTPRSEVRSQTPSRGSAPPRVSRSEVRSAPSPRSSGSGRSSPPARSQAPSRPSAPPRSPRSR